MAVDPVTAWLSRTIETERRNTLGVVIAGAFGGLIALVVTFAFTYGAIWFISFSLLSVSSVMCFWITAALMVALFIGNITTSREYLESYSFTTGTASDKVVSFDVPQVGMVSNINPIAPDSAHSFLKMFTSILFTAPRLVMGAIHGVARWKRLGSLDLEGCGAILGHLLQNEHRVALTDIGEAFHHRSLERLLPQLAEVSGVLFLKSPPPGLSLSTDLRREILSSMKT
jgi:hypothetical protein